MNKSDKSPIDDQDYEVVIPPGFEADIGEVQQLATQAQRDPQIIGLLIQLDFGHSL